MTRKCKMKMHNVVSRLRNAGSKVVAGASVALTSASAFAGDLSEAVAGGVDKTELTAIGVIVLGIAGVILLIRSGKRAAS